MGKMISRERDKARPDINVTGLLPEVVVNIIFLVLVKASSRRSSDFLTSLFYGLEDEWLHPEQRFVLDDRSLNFLAIFI